MAPNFQEKTLDTLSLNGFVERRNQSSGCSTMDTEDALMVIALLVLIIVTVYGITVPILVALRT
ncbi:MAG: hypothetical protein C4K49_07415 [Candidatus Thorarchaeota archaeon]|nr:MAG: hypothetical protein C4K49_07415 [Candidatus Thorarchaeota archaeon]